MRWPGETGRAKRFARLLDHPPTDGPDDAELAPLVAVVDQLRTVDRIQPDAEFRAALRGRLVSLAIEAAPESTVDATAQTDVVPDRRGRRSRGSGGLDDLSSRWRRPRLGLVAASLVLLVVAGLAVVGSRNALPGDPLYALKRGTENAGLALARGDEARGLRYLRLARVRAQEIQDLPGRDSDAGAATFVDTLGVMDQQTKAGVRLLTAAAVNQGVDTHLVEVGTWTVQQYDLLQATSARLPAAVQPRLGESLALLRRVGGRVVELRTRLGCACLVNAAQDDLGPQLCNPCDTAQAPAGSSQPGPSRPTSPGRPSQTAAPPSGGPRPSGRPSPTGGSGSHAPGGGLPLPLPLPSGGGNVPLPSIPGLPLPSSVPLPSIPGLPLPSLPLPSLPLPTLPVPLPLPTGSLLPSGLPGLGGG